MSSYEKQIVRTKDETYTHIHMYVRHFGLHISYLSKLIREPSRTKASREALKMLQRVSCSRVMLLAENSAGSASPDSARNYS